MGPIVVTIRPTARALNRPLLVAGFDRNALGLSLMTAVLIASNTSRLLGLLIFCALVWGTKIALRKDERFFQIALPIWRQKAEYDCFARELFDVQIIGEAEIEDED